jgi:hypothetical protein
MICRIVIWCTLGALFGMAGESLAASAPAPVPTATPGVKINLWASGKTLAVVRTGTEVHIRASEIGAIPKADRPATLQILGGYEYRGQTQAHVLKKCKSARCGIDPTIRTPATWTYQAFLIGKGGVALAQSKMVKVKWVRREAPATEP